MLKNYARVALRHLAKRPGYALVNIVGLAVGLAACLLIALYVHDEWRYDRHDPAAERIVRLAARFGDRDVTVTPSLVAPALRREIPEVEAVARLYDVASYGDVVVEHEGTRYAEDRFLYADSTVFDVFTLPFESGTAEGALARPGTMVLTRSAAARYFGDGDPIGETLTVGGGRTFEITGVLADPPRTTHLPYRFIASLETLRGWGELQDDQLRGAQFLTYVRLRGADVRAAFDRKLADWVERTFEPMRAQSGLNVSVVVQPLTDIHLHYGTGSATSVAAAGVIALLLLLVACVNFMNLATARSTERAKEVGVRKVVGARRGALVGQFLAEAVLMSLAAAVGALLLAEAGLPLLRALAGTAFEFRVLTEPALIAGVLGVAVAVGLLAGLYPAFVLSRFEPVAVLKGSFGSSRQGRRLRTVLVVFQFAVVVFLLVGTLVVQRQMQYVQTKDVGFDKERVVVLPLPDRAARGSVEALSGAFRDLAVVEAVTPISSVPGAFNGGYSLYPGDEPDPEGLGVLGIFTGGDVVRTLGLDLVAGAGMPERAPGAVEGGHAFLLNEEAVRRMGWTPETAVGRPASLHGREGEVRGVVADFHYATLHEAIEPLVFFLADEGYNHLLVRMRTADLAATIGGLEAAWGDVLPGTPFDFEFLDRQFDAQYRAERRAGLVFAVFAGLAVFVACLGLLGLAAFTAQQRTKEIGVRKVHGARVSELVLLLTRDVVGLVVVAFVVAAPVGYFAMQRWLEGFAYRTGLSWTVFAVALAVTLVLAVGAVAYQAVRAATADPIDALRYE